MQKLTREGLLEVIEMLEDEFEVKVSDSKFNMYLQLLGDITDEQLQRGIINLLRNREYNQHKFPKVSEIREFTLGRQTDKLQSKIEMAKLGIKNAIPKHGGYCSVAFDDPVIHFIIKNRFGGWSGICTEEAEELENFFKFEFDRIYKAGVENGIGLVPLRLKGREEVQNEGKYDYERIEYIGDKLTIDKWQKKALQLESGAAGKVEELTQIKSVGLN